MKMTTRSTNSVHGSPGRSTLFLIPFLIVCAAFSQMAQALTPPPDGGYAGGNTAEGQNALLRLTAGTYNTAIGFLSLESNITGNFNTAIGAGTLLASTADQNTATGAGALLSNTAGGFNTADGAFTLFSNTTGSQNTANGDFAGFSNTTGDLNTATGSNALQSNTTGNGNTANGASALFNNITGNGNIALGTGAGDSVTTADNVICIGASGQDVSNSCFIGQIFGATSSGGTTVFINSDGKLGTSTSSRRFKEEITPMDRASEALFALKPVRFRYKKAIDPAGTSQFGLVAEEVEKVNRDLVVRDKEGRPYSVRYDQVNAMLLNEFLKEHRKNEEQEAIIAELESGMTALAATVKEQAAQLQRVSAQLDASRSTPQLVLKDQ